MELSIKMIFFLLTVNALPFEKFLEAHYNANNIYTEIQKNRIRKTIFVCVNNHG